MPARQLEAMALVFALATIPGRATEGCVAMARDALARWLDAMTPGDAIQISAE